MHPFDWKLLKSEYVLQTRWLSLRADTCQLPTGHIITPYYVLEYPTWVNIVALTTDLHVILVRQYRHGVQQTVLELPSGSVEQTDASPLVAAQRELCEETGYTSDAFVETGRVSPNAANHANLTYCFLATAVERIGEPVADETEHVETVCVPLPEVIELARRGELLQAMHISSLFFALNTLGRLQWT